MTKLGDFSFQHNKINFESHDSLILGMEDKYPNLHVQDPWLSYIINGKKSVECRPGPATKFVNYIGKKVLLWNERGCIWVIIAGVRHYSTLGQFLITEKLSSYAPHVNNVEEAFRSYMEIKDSDGKTVFDVDSIEIAGGVNALFIELM